MTRFEISPAEEESRRRFWEAYRQRTASHEHTIANLSKERQAIIASFWGMRLIDLLGPVSFCLILLGVVVGAILYGQDGAMAAFILGVIVVAIGSKLIPNKFIENAALKCSAERWRLAQANVLEAEQEKAKIYNTMCEQWYYYPPDWQERRAAVMARDQRRCTKCGKTSDNLHVHHLKPLSFDGSNALDNLTTLCRGCHADLHPNVTFQNVLPLQ